MEELLVGRASPRRPRRYSQHPGYMIESSLAPSLQLAKALIVNEHSVGISTKLSYGENIIRGRYNEHISNFLLDTLASDFAQFALVFLFTKRSAHVLSHACDKRKSAGSTSSYRVGKMTIVLQCNH